LGVPRGLRGTALPFAYNKIEELKSIFDLYPGEVGTVVMEPLRNYSPEPGFLESVKALANSRGAILIFDEVSSGFRLNAGGAHMTLGIYPDIAVFAKAMSNGYPMAAIIGRQEAMDAVERTFISSTYWTDRIGPAAALATINKYRQENVNEHLCSIGQNVQDLWRNTARDVGLEVDIYGIYPMSYFSFKGVDSQVKMTFYVQEMLKHGFLASNRFYANNAQSNQHVEHFGKAIRNIFQKIVSFSSKQSLSDLLIDEVSRPGFHRLN
jgi:glutamate-1-semialdehyde aminotransferase